MTWSTPLTAVANAALTAAQWNASVRDNLNETAPAKATSNGSYFVGTGSNAIAERTSAVASNTLTDTTTATTFGDLSSTSGPAVTVTSGQRALVLVASRIVNNTVGAVSRTGWAISGATTLGASVDLSVAAEAAVVSQDFWVSGAWLYTGFTAGSNTITMKYRVDSASTGSFGDRRVSVLPF